MTFNRKVADAPKIDPRTMEIISTAALGQGCPTNASARALVPTSISPRFACRRIPTPQKLPSLEPATLRLSDGQEAK